MPATPTFSPSEIDRLIRSLAASIRQRHPAPEKLVLLGVANCGIILSRRIAALLGSDRLGTVDISFHRDDLERNPIPKEYAPTLIPFDVNQATLILIDDVLFSVRTIKAALDEVFDYGRPAKVELAVLIDRGGRTVPLQADYVGQTLSLSAGHHIRVKLDPADPKDDEILVVPKVQAK